jgi:hypothetical protein
MEPYYSKASSGMSAALMSAASAREMSRIEAVRWQDSFARRHAYPVLTQAKFRKLT